MERLRTAGHIRRPTAEQIRSLGAMQYLNLTDEEIQGLEPLIEDALKMMDRLDDLPIPQLQVKYHDRDPGYRPSPEENPHNAFIRKCLVKGAPSGILAGKRAAMKDNIRVAGVPMTNASNLVGEYVPTVDATVVERLLDAGATIVGKLNLDDFSMTGTGEGSVFGPPRNPHNPAYSPGGSSGGTAAAVAAGEIDIGLGVDQGGSGRIPAAWCGVPAIKATHGLIPTFGLTHLDHTIDFITPTARSVEDVALTLEALAGDDPKDPQWVRGPLKVDKYSETLRKGVTGVKIGVIKESFDWSFLEQDVAQAVRAAIRKLDELGTESREVSITWWKDSWAIWGGIATHSIMAMVESDLEGYGRGGYCDVNWQQAFGKARRVRGDDLPPRMKVLMLAGKYLQREYYSTYFSKATNLKYGMIQDLDKLLQDVDVLVTPTVAFKALKLLDEPLTVTELGNRGPSQQGDTPLTPANTCATNVTGHPTVTIPCGIGEHGLPISLQLIGRRFDESLLLRVAYSFEQSRVG